MRNLGNICSHGLQLTILNTIFMWWRKVWRENWWRVPGSDCHICPGNWNSSYRDDGVTQTLVRGYSLRHSIPSIIIPVPRVFRLIHSQYWFSHLCWWYNNTKITKILDSSAWCFSVGLCTCIIWQKWLLPPPQYGRFDVGWWHHCCSVQRACSGAHIIFSLATATSRHCLSPSC